MDFKTLFNKQACHQRLAEQRSAFISNIRNHSGHLLAPTATNRQQCKFIIIQNCVYIKKLSDESKKSLLSDLEQNPESPLKQYEPRCKPKP